MKTESTLAQLGIAQVAIDTLLGVQLGIWPFEKIAQECRASVYWPEFCHAAKSGEIRDDWLPGALGRMILREATKGF